MKTKRSEKSTTGRSRSRPISGQPGAGKGQREDVRGSRVYPASGPFPRGSAVVRTDAAWGRGPKANTGYAEDDAEESSLLPQKLPSSRVAEPASELPRPEGQTRSSGREIPRKDWLKFFDRFSRDYAGRLASIEVTARGESFDVEARQLPLLGVSVDLHPRDKSTTAIMLDVRPSVHITHTVPLTEKVVFREEDHELEIDASNGDKAILRFEQ